MFNEYYPENTSSDCFENYGGHHIDDRMRELLLSLCLHHEGPVQADETIGILKQL